MTMNPDSFSDVVTTMFNIDANWTCCSNNKSWILTLSQTWLLLLRCAQSINHSQLLINHSSNWINPSSNWIKQSHLLINSSSNWINSHQTKSNNSKTIQQNLLIQTRSSRTLFDSDWIDKTTEHSLIRIGFKQDK
jgi:hypothetical protein